MRRDWPLGTGLRHDEAMNEPMPHRHPLFPALAALLLMALVLAGCSSGPSVEDRIPPTSDTREAVASLALEQLGKPYRDDAAGPKAFDAAGLAAFAYRGAGASLPADAQAQLDAGKPIELTDAKPADLVVFRVETAGGGDRLLVGLYLTTDEMLMATPGVQGEPGVRLLALDGFWQQRLVGVIRVLP